MSPCPSAATEERTTWGGGPLLELGLSESAPARVRAHGSAPDASSPLNASVPSRLSTMLIDAAEPTPSLAYPCRFMLVLKINLLLCDDSFVR
ncbi:hypothetical protein EJB05_18280, partial [Eragrostis curvula]